MTTFTAQVATPQATAMDPNKHVKYTLGMVLGVDDFDQEFAYLAGRDQWLARDLLGYGTVSGLQVTVEPDARGPQVVVSAGSAVNPIGQLIRVPLAQCAFLNDWLVAHRTEVSSRVVPEGSPPSFFIRLSVVLAYRDCPVDQVPIPGEPCRTEDQATIASRIADDFDLELRFDSPDQLEEDALRRFVAWLARVEVNDSAEPFVAADLERAIQSAARLPGSPPCSPAEFMLSSPPTPLRVRSVDTAEFLRAAFRIWTTQLRPRWRVSGLLQDWTCADARPDHAGDANSVLLAELKIPLVRATTATTPDWQVVSDLSRIERNEQRRPYIVHLRMLQEWLLGGRPGLVAGGAASTGPGSPPRFGLDPYTVVAAGVVRADASRRATVFNGLFAETIADGQVILRFDNLRATDPAVHYIVKAVPVYGPVGGQVTAPRTPIVTFDHLDGPRGGLVIFVTDGTAPIPGATLTQVEFMVEISQY
jgi:hypothetical protein